MKRLLNSALVLILALATITSLAGCFKKTTTSTRPRLTISVSPSMSGTVITNPAGPLYDQGTEVTLLPTPSPGYAFSAWSGADGSSVVANKVTMDKSKSVTAVFAPRIAFDSNRYDGDDSDIYVMNADGTNPTRLTDDPMGEDSPAWSPDRTKIAFSRYDGDSWEIWVVNSDGSGVPTQLTSNTFDISDGAPAWSPDGTTIAFTHWNALLGTSEIWVMDANGLGPEPLIDDTTAGYPAWSPDGEKIAFNSRRDGNYEIYVMNADGSGVPARLTDNPAFDGSPAWSPDGTKIAFVSDRDINDNVWVMNATDGFGLTQLTDGAFYDAEPTWSLDGTKIAFASDRGGNNQIYVMNADGSGAPAQLTDDDTFYSEFPAW